MVSCETPDKYIITIDGPAASGKGTLASKLADELRFIHLDTGALYRAVACEVLENGEDPDDEEKAVAAAKTVTHKISELLDPADRSKTPSSYLRRPALRQEEVASAASKVSAMPGVRDALYWLQRSFAENAPCGAILEGRDTGTVICPEADLKLFITADIEERAKRRVKELQSRGKDVTHEAVLKDMRARDERDQSRDTAPLKPAEEAVTIDTTGLSEQGVLDKALEIVNENLS